MSLVKINMQITKLNNIIPSDVIKIIWQLSIYKLIMVYRLQETGRIPHLNGIKLEIKITWSFVSYFCSPMTSCRLDPYSEDNFVVRRSHSLYWQWTSQDRVRDMNCSRSGRWPITLRLREWVCLDSHDLTQRP